MHVVIGTLYDILDFCYSLTSVSAVKKKRNFAKRSDQEWSRLKSFNRVWNTNLWVGICYLTKTLPIL